MTKKSLCLLWGAGYILCAGLGFIPGFSDALSPAAQGVLTALALLFFLPPAVLLHQAAKAGDISAIKLVRNLSALSLGLTALTLVISFALSMAPEWVGEMLHVVLILVSSPMVCSGYWALSLFLWACLLMAALSTLRNMRKG